MDDQEQLRAHMKAAGARFEPAPAACPSNEELIAHYHGSADAAARERIESHLMQCPACRAALHDVAEFFAPPRASERPLAPAAVDREYERLARRIGQRSTPRWMLAVAACLVAGLALSASWALRETNQRITAEQRLRDFREQSEKQIAELRAPRLNTSVHDVFASDAVARSGGSSAATRVRVREGAPFTLLLTGEGVPALTEYAIEIADAQGQTVWRGEGLRRNALGGFSLTLTGGFLAEGNYRLRLLDTSGRVLTEYAINVEKLP